MYKIVIYEMYTLYRIYIRVHLIPFIYSYK